MQFQIKAIGKIRVKDNAYSIQLDKAFLPGLKNISGFSHLQIIWWGHLSDKEQDRDRLVLNKLFKQGPDTIGVFATRSPARPNPLLVSTIKVQEIDFDDGVIYTPFIDAVDQTPVLDIKPYYAMERVRDVKDPEWCQHWPQWLEDSEKFNWQNEIVTQKDMD